MWCEPKADKSRENIMRIINPPPRLPLHGREQSPAQLILGMVVIGVIAALLFGGMYWAIWH